MKGKQSIISSKNIYYLLSSLTLIFLVCIGFYLRAKDLSLKFMWEDEFYTEERAFWSLRELWNYYITQRELVFCAIMKLYGIFVAHINHGSFMNTFQLRFPNVIIGTICIIFIFYSNYKIKDIISGLIAASITTFLYFTVYFSREARFYPLFFLLSCFLISAAFEILKGNRTIRPYIYYSLIGLTGLYTHSGFWIFFAISNVFLVLYLFIMLLYEWKSYTNKLSGLCYFILKVFILATPVFLTIPLFFSLNGPNSTRPSFDGTMMIQKLNYSTINNFYIQYWKHTPFAEYVLLGIAIIVLFFILSSLICFFKSSNRCKINSNSNLQTLIITLYLVSISIFPFVIASYIPRSAIREPLRAKYFIFILVSNIFLISYFFSEVLDLVLVKIVNCDQYIKRIIKLICALIFISWFGFSTTNKIFKSDLFKPDYSIEKAANKLCEVYSDDCYVFSDARIFNLWIRYAVRAGILPHDFLFSKPDLSGDKILPERFKWLLIITEGAQKKDSTFPAVSFLGKYGWESFYSVKNIKGQMSTRLVKGIFANVTEGHKGNTLQNWVNSWKEKYTTDYVKNIINGVNYDINSTNFIKNPSFLKSFEDWEGNLNFFKIEKEDDFNYLSLVGNDNSNWKILRTYFFAEEGKYVFSVDSRLKKGNNKGQTLITLSEVTDNKKNVNTNYLGLDKKKLSNEWQRIYINVNLNKTGIHCFQVQYTFDGFADFKDFKLSNDM